MYAQRFADGPRFRPASLGAAVVINAGIITALLFANPDILPGPKPAPPLDTFNVPPPEPPPPPDPVQKKVEPRPAPTTTVVTPKPPIDVKLPITNPITNTDLIRPIDPISVPGTGTGAGSFPINPPITPRFIAAREDPRYVGDFQPDYPDYERDAGREDVVKLRVRIGVDGRVKQVERLGGRDSFARIAIAHALAKWRFLPATRGDVPEESWRVMTVRFTINN